MDPMDQTLRRLATQMRAKAPQCPYCGNIAPYGDARHQWMNLHLNSWRHRGWWKLRPKFFWLFDNTLGRLPFVRKLGREDA